MTQVLDDPRFGIILSKINDVVHDDTHYQKGALNIRTQKCFCIKSGISGKLLFHYDGDSSAQLSCGYVQTELAFQKIYFSLIALILITSFEVHMHVHINHKSVCIQIYIIHIWRGEKPLHTVIDNIDLYIFSKLQTQQIRFGKSSLGYILMPILWA